MSFVSCAVLPVLGYLIMAILTVTPRTYPLRLALWPFITLLSVRAGVAVSVVMSHGGPNQRCLNTLFTILMIVIATRTLDWALSKEPIARHNAPQKGYRTIITDALDLASSMRGQGWGWRRNVYTPREARPTDRTGFTIRTILSLVTHCVLSGVTHISLRSFSPTGHGIPSGESIFDSALLLHIRYIRASAISACAVIGMYASIQTYYDVCTIIAVVFLRHDPVQWPPAFDSPWRATSLASFWGRRWHQFFRRTFLIQGGYPLAFFAGRAGLVIGSFLSSGVLHHIAVISLNDRSEPWRIIVGFEMMALGILAEQAFRTWTGKEVGGIMGWVWTMSWISLWGNVIIDGFARAGVLSGYLIFSESVVPRTARTVVEHVVASFDSWLQTL